MGGQHATYVCMRVKHILVVSVSTICVGGKRTYSNGMPTVQNTAHAVPPAFFVCLNRRFEYAT